MTVADDAAASAAASATAAANSLTFISDVAEQVVQTKVQVDNAIANLVAGAPAALNTLDELAAALGDDANYAATVTTALNNRLRVDTAAQGLTGTQQTNARTNLALGDAATKTVGAASGVAGLDGSAKLLETNIPTRLSDTSLSASIEATAGRTFRLETYGAVGDGTTDDQTAIATTLAAMQAGDTLILTDGLTFAHSTRITITTPGIRITGGGILKGTGNADVAVFVNADDVLFDGVTVQNASTGRTSSDYGCGFLVPTTSSGVQFRRCRVNGTAAAGWLIRGTDWTLDHCTVQNSRADGFHITGGASGGRWRNLEAISTGDDGFAVVSYATDAAACSDIKGTGFRGSGSSARGFTVGGGTNIEASDIVVSSSNGAGLYIAAESAYDLRTTDTVLIKRVELRGCNTGSPTLDHGSLLVFTDHATSQINNVEVDDVTIIDQGTSANAAAMAKVLRTAAGTMSNIKIRKIRARGAIATSGGFPLVNTGSGLASADIFTDGLDYGSRSTAPTPTSLIGGSRYFNTTTQVENRWSTTTSAWGSIISGDANSSFVLGAADFAALSGAPDIAAAGSTARYVSRVFDSATSEIVGAVARIPSHWATYDIYILWTNPSASSGNVYWDLRAATATNGSALPTHTLLNAAAFAAGGQWVYTSQVIASGQTVTGTRFIQLGRLGADASDTLANDAAFLGLAFIKVT